MLLLALPAVVVAQPVVTVLSGEEPSNPFEFDVQVSVEHVEPLVAVELRVRAGDAIEWLTTPMVSLDDGTWTAGVSSAAGMHTDYYVYASEGAVGDVKTTTIPEDAPNNYFRAILSGEDGSGSCAQSPAQGAWWMVASIAGLLLGPRRRL
ncbi:MAG: hypothetical protein ACJAYU_000755 [Bradymonadia bacterium]